MFKNNLQVYSKTASAKMPIELVICLIIESKRALL
jgi:hypothetical protein